MNRSITGAWGTNASSSRRNKISLNAAQTSASPAASGSQGSSTEHATTANGHINTAPASSRAGSQWIVPNVLPAGSAAAAAAAREMDTSAGGSTSAVGDEERVATELAEEAGARVAAASDLAEMEGQMSEGTNALVKRKLRNVSSSASDASPAVDAAAMPSTGTPTRTKRRKAIPAGSANGNAAGINGRSSSNAVMPTARLKDLGGVKNALDKVLELIAMPLCHPEVYAHTGVKPPRGVLLHGPPGCGKTMLAGALAGELNVPLFSISSPSIVSGTSGESEQTLRRLFDEAISSAPCILFLDEIDAITPKRETASREMERRIVAQLLTLLDDLTWDKTQGKPVMIIGATNRPDAIDPALRRAGRFDHEIALGVPDEAGREEILQILCAGLRLSGDFDLRSLAKQTPGFVGADLVALTAAAGIRSVKRIFSQLAEQGRDIDMADQDGVDVVAGNGSVPNNVDLGEVPERDVEGGTFGGAQGIATASDLAEGRVNETAPLHAVASASLFEALPASLQTSAIATFLRTHPTPLSASQLQQLHITPDDFLAALPTIQPSSKREGFATVPEVTWSDIGALEATREELEMTIVEPIKHPELFQAIGVSSSGGVLLWGPPGCGKTLLAKAVANESGANFISVKGPELLNKYVGESERAVRQVFARARTSSPCVIFFDELDALVPRRDDALSESSSRVVNTLLTELDGMEARMQTYVIGATNRPDMIDPAMCRPGRLDKLLYVDLPNTLERMKILQTLTQKTPLKRTADSERESDLAKMMGAVTVQSGDVQEQIRHAAERGVAWLCQIALDARCEGFSGADLAALVREASVLALRERLRATKQQEQEQEPKDPTASTLTVSTPPQSAHGSFTFSSGAPQVKVIVQVDASHFGAALDKVQPSVGVAQRKKYEQLRSRLSGLPGGQKAANRKDAEASEP